MIKRKACQQKKVFNHLFLCCFLAWHQKLGKIHFWGTNSPVRGESFLRSWICIGSDRIGTFSPDWGYVCPYLSVGVILCRIELKSDWSGALFVLSFNSQNLVHDSCCYVSYHPINGPAMEGAIECVLQPAMLSGHLSLGRVGPEHSQRRQSTKYDKSPDQGKSGTVVTPSDDNGQWNAYSNRQETDHSGTDSGNV